MRKLLIISYMFPPIAGIPVQRSLKFVKYLPKFDVEPIVFCPKIAAWRTVDANAANLDFIKRTKVYRCGINRLQKYYDLRFRQGYVNHFYYYWLGLRYVWFIDFISSWYFECKNEVLQIAEKERVDSVFTTSPPHSTHFFGLYLKKKLGIPWVMDLRDAMYNDPNKDTSVFALRIQALIELFYERKFYSLADAITSVSQPILDSICRRHIGLDLESKLRLITNGFDDEDFMSIKRDHSPRNYLLITYTGSFLAKRTPEHFLEAIRLLVERGTVNPSELRIRFVGSFEGPVRDIIHRMKSILPIEIIGFQPYEQSIAYQVNTDVLLLIVTADESEGGDQIFTGKFFEYLGAQRPIFALAPNGPLKETIEKGRFGVVAPSKNIPEIASKFQTLYDNWRKQKSLAFNPDLAMRECFTRKRLTQKLAATVEEVIRIAH